ncbi:hypothetical protein [Planococcus wigleyi]|uniref:Uncharacterized protein n=1 Tax=Planococcus wigleyi TaxID=2762216 RepID=A0ABR8WAV1_9BACL|nr:hypothetical protein [Planococcus wigleyi]MBD8014107.1 hypothetical protein [Planococcus wigleyi]
MKIAWTLYLTGLAFVIIYFNTGSDIYFAVGLVLQLTGFCMQSFHQKKEKT